MANRQDETQRKYLAGLYAQGIITAEEFIEIQHQRDLEEVDRLNARVAEIMGADYLTEDKPKKEEPKQPTEQPKDNRPSLVGMTKEQFNSLSLNEQNELYKIAPDIIRKMLEERPAYMDFIDVKPKAKDYKGLTPADFKSMRVDELQELWDTDPDTYKKVLEEIRATDPAW